jgi:hypothetical protein
MPTSANTPDQWSDRYARYIQVGPTPATHLSRWVHRNGTTKSHPLPSIVKALTPSQLADTPSSPLPHNHAHLGRDSLTVVKVENGPDRGRGNSAVPPLLDCGSVLVEVNVVRPATIIIRCLSGGRSTLSSPWHRPGRAAIGGNGSVWSPRFSGSACLGSWLRCAPGHWPGHDPVLCSDP